MSIDYVGPDKVARREFGRTGDWLRKLERSRVIPPAPRDFAGYRFYPPRALGSHPRDSCESAARQGRRRGVRIAASSA
jgi:hypothetical protein